MNPGKVIKPYVTEEMAREMVQRIYGLDVIYIQQMVSFDDRNFHIKVSAKHQNPHLITIWPHGYTLKVTNILKSAIPGHFESMHLAMRHLSEKGLRVPLPIPNLDGVNWKFEKIPLLQRGGAEPAIDQQMESSSCGVHLLTFLPGVPVGDVSFTTNILYQWGHLLAQFQNATQDFSNKVLKEKDIFWSLTHVPEIEQFMEGLEEDKASLIWKVLRSYSEEVAPALSPLRTGYIHGDFNENNVLVRKSSNEEDPESSAEYKVDGIIDLEDMHYGTFLWDVAMMLAYTSLNCDSINPLDGMGHALAGYIQLRPLNENEMKLLKICVASRLCQSLVLGAYCYRMDPTNSYTLTSSRTGWSRLKLIWETPNEILLERWEKIQMCYSVNN